MKLGLQVLTWSWGCQVESVRVEPVLQIVDNLLVGEVSQRLLVAVRENLPQGHAEGPNVALWRPEPLQRSKQNIMWLEKKDHDGDDTEMIRRRLFFLILHHTLQAHQRPRGLVGGCWCCYYTIFVFTTPPVLITSVISCSSRYSNFQKLQRRSTIWKHAAYTHNMSKSSPISMCCAFAFAWIFQHAE